ncbi:MULTISPECIES: DoxX family protein [Halorubrum]|jgi:thiosulfate dehydrogenase [quinone] large subunit|uniref:DoxX family protein n=1 Tax=Halorubrum tropicale TaxID=1765655 RepID=A0A0M9APP8_9EURY|nr:MULTISPECIES: DoxX family protein [Halorubrum]KOX96329.1 DoxX family protein [Halorubrum tropicale]RLM52586.1 DoxX family protein [Halorubrum sp. Atlit-28R]TKX45729.1 DoxX family protein [Halorubrum sp. ARQ200]TKX51194.1 DoxX family protein [Halorubrum sp. ASP121]TKX63825.1 DoxX family protein [Halorubrum sp. ASP1]
MSYQSSNPLVGEVEFALEGPWATYWIAFLRVVTGWWFFHAGVTKIITDGFAYSYGPAYMQQMSGTVLGGIPVWMGNNLAWLIEPGVPLFETLIGLALMAGALTRFAAFGGVIFMILFWVGNAGFGHGVVNSDLMGLLLFMTVIVLAAGRYYGLDAIIEDTELVKQNPKLRYLLG